MMEMELEMEAMAREMERLLRIPDEMESMLHQPARSYVKNTKAVLRTPVDVYERPDSFTFYFDMPGLELDKIKVKVDGGILHVSGKKKKSKGTEVKDEGVKPIVVERKTKRYMRKFTLPENADEEDVKAVYKDGVLVVTIAKKPQEEAPPKPKVVSIPVM